MLLCFLEMIALLIKHHLLSITGLCNPSHPFSPILTPSALDPSPWPVATATGISFLKCQFALLSSRFPAITSPSKCECVCPSVRHTNTNTTRTFIGFVVSPSPLCSVALILLLSTLLPQIQNIQHKVNAA